MKASYNDVIESIYAAACDPDKWSQALAKVAIMTGSKSAALLYRDHEIGTANAFASYGVTQDWVLTYNEKYSEEDPVYHLFISSVAAGEVTTVQDGNEVSLSQFFSSDVYRNFYQPLNMYYMAGGLIFKDAVRTALIAVQRGHDELPYSPSTLEEFKQVLPHFQRALKIHRDLTRVKLQQEGILAGINELNSGIILFDCMARVIYTNKSADTILKQHPAIQHRGNTILTCSSADNTKLRTAIIHAVNERHQNNTPSSFAMGLFHPDKLFPLPVSILPIKQGDIFTSLTTQQVGAAMFICDPEAPTTTSPEKLESIYGLTHREAEIAIDITNGLLLKEVAIKQKISLDTVHTHRSTIFSKIGIGRQVDLVRLVMNTP